MEIQDDVGQRAGLGRRPLGDPAIETLVVDLVEDFNSAAEWEALVRLVLNRAVRETRSDRGVISWIDGNEMIVAGCHDPFGELVEVGSRWPLASDEVSVVALAAGRPEAGAFDSIDIDGISPGLRATYSGLRHLLVVPVSVAGEDIAIVCVSRRRSEEFTAADSEILDAIARAGAQPLRAARLDDMLGAALAELSEQLASAESVERIKTDILRLASHELRTPLTVLHGYLSLVRAGHFGDIPEPLDRIMKILERRTEEMNELVNDMLVAARIEDGPSDSEEENIDLRSVVRDAVDAVAPRASARHRLRVELPGQPVFARVDSERIVLALRNIIDNAVKYSPNGGEVVCTLSEASGTASVRIADHGLGIAAEGRDKLFTRFGRVVTATNSHIPGIGLGLYFTREVARRHGGDVALIEAEGPGSIFEMTLPAQRGEPA
jgi:signal transduction histidine kinase